MNRIQLLLAELDSAYTKSRWHSLKSALKGLTGEDAQWVPSKFKGFPFMNGSILDIVFHVGADQLVQISQRFGDRSVSWQTMTERFQREGRTLDAALKIMEEGHATLRSVLASLSDDDLEKQSMLDGRVMRNDEFFRMMIEHDVYHAGQIRYIRNMLDGLNEAKLETQE